MSLFSKLFEDVEHEAKPLLSTAAKWAESTGLVLVREVAAEVKAKGPGELVTLFNATIGLALGGLTLPVGATLSADALDLLTTALARSKAAAVSGTSIRSSILNAGIEQAVLLVKGAVGDTATTPTTPAVKTGA